MLLLPTTLIAFLLLSPNVLSAHTTPNDPFRALSTHRPEQPVCCLIPLPPVEPVDEDVLLTFEEWKAKQLSSQARAAQAKEKESSSRSAASQAYVTGETANNGRGEPSSDPVAADAVPAPSTSTSVEFEDNSAGELLSPHFRVPLTDRFNYASLDCSARVHTAHKSAKSPSSILSSKKDRYMLSPCGKTNGQTQFVVVELCEDIRIDTVQLANFEFFSGVFKDFTVSVAKTYTTDVEGWTVAGTYKAKNVRGVQSFHPPTSLRDFYRYIRIDFLSHYSNEYYCPISLLRVYGLTHLEQWKWDIWEAESRAKRDELEKARSILPSLPVEAADAPQPVQTSIMNAGHGRGFPANATREEVENFMDSLEDATTAMPLTENTTIDVEESIAFGLDDTSTQPSSSADSSSEASVLVKTSGDTTLKDIKSGYGPSGDAATSPVDLTENESTAHNVPRQAIAPDTPSDITLPASPASNASPTPDASADQHSPSHISISPEYTTTNTTLIVNHASSSPSSSRLQSPSPSVANGSPSPIIPAIPFVHPPVPPVVTGGESIYRTIMNRLTALEANNTLYARYVEDQTASVREMLKRLGEDVGRLEGIGKAQAQMYQRTVKEWERQRHRLEMEHWELMSRVDYLADEIVLEKRLGIAQLCLLLAVLVFMGLTRGSRGEALPDHGHAPAKFNKSMREWSRRHLSFSGDWASRFRSRSLTPLPPTRTPNVRDDKIEFPSSPRPPLQPPFTSRTPLPPDRAMQIKQMNASVNERRPATAVVTSMSKRSRTPTSLRTPTRHLNGHHHRPITPSGSHHSGRPHLLRTNSQGATGDTSPFGFAGIGPVPRSAKKWARSAHLHEVRVKDDRVKGTVGSRGYRDRENDTGNIFGSPIFPVTGNSPSEPIGDALNLADKKGKGPRTFSMHRKPLSPLPVKHLSLDTSDGTENDLWVDTDADGSEMDINSEPDEVSLQSP